MTLRGDNQLGPSSVGPGGVFGHIDDWSEYAVDYLDGRLSPEDKAAVQQHLADCPACASRMAAQQGVITFLQRTPLEEAPEDLEDRAIGELLFPSSPDAKPAFRGHRMEQREAPRWTRRFRPWIPVTSVVAVVLIGIVLFGVLRSNSQLETASREVESTVAADQTVVAALPESGDTLSTAAAMMTSTTTAGASTTSTETTKMSTADVPVAIREKKEMVAALESADAPVYIAFEALVELETGTSETVPDQSAPLTTNPGDSSGSTAETIPADVTDEVIAEIAAFTGLEILPSDLSMGGPTFAAFVSRKQVSPFLDLLFSIKSSLRIDLALRMEPDNNMTENASHIEAQKAGLPVLIGQITPQPAVNRYTFTTSTPPMYEDSSTPTDVVTPDDEGTHILIVIFVRN